MPLPAGHILAFAALAALLTACSGPQHGPMTSLAKARSFGYQETRIGGGIWEITYFGAVARLSPGIEQDAQVDIAVRRSRDLALWRTAQIAGKAGRPSFDVLDERVDTRVHNDRGGYYYPFHRRVYPYGYRYGYPWPHGYFRPPSARGRAWVTLRVRLREDTGGRFNARLLRQRMAARYGSAAPPRKTRNRP
jgi:hypothetical protein